MRWGCTGLLRVLPCISWLRRRQLELRVQNCKTKLLPDGLPPLLHGFSLILLSGFLQFGLMLVLLSRSVGCRCMLCSLDEVLPLLSI